MVGWSCQGSLTARFYGLSVYKGGAVYGEGCHSLHELGWVVVQLRDLLSHMSSAIRAPSSAVQSTPLPCTLIKRWLTV